jgi:hypothetical protein
MSPFDVGYPPKDLPARDFAMLSQSIRILPVLSNLSSSGPSMRGRDRQLRLSHLPQFIWIAVMSEGIRNLKFTTCVHHVEVAWDLLERNDEQLR